MVDLLPIQGHGKLGLCTFERTFVPPEVQTSFDDEDSATFNSLQRSVLLSEWLLLTADSNTCVMARIRNVRGPVTGALNSELSSWLCETRERQSRYLRYLRYFVVDCHERN